MRAKMVNWIVQVYRVLRKSSDHTFFLAISIMDRFIVKYASHLRSAENRESAIISYHLVGLVSLWMSSKLEDVIPIFISQVIKDAGHDKFSKDEVLAQESLILKILNFKLYSNDIYLRAMTSLKEI